MVENTTTDYALDGSSGNVLSKDGAKAAASYVGQQVTKMKNMAQEGPLSFRLLAFIGAVVMVITSILDFLHGLIKVSVTHVIIAVFVCAFAFIICILEGKDFLPQPALALQSKMYKHARFLRIITGRGVFYFFAGLLQFSHWSFLNIISGGFMMFVGILYVIVGRATAKKLAGLRAALRDETTLQVKFADHDEDQDGYLTQTDFDKMVMSLGLALSHNELVAAFATIHNNDDGKISFDEFKT